VQQFVTPQMGRVEPYYLKSGDLKRLGAKPPRKSDPKNPGYKAQADEVLAASAHLTDEQKVMAEFFNNTVRSLGATHALLDERDDHTLEEFVWVRASNNAASFDATIVAFADKLRYDAVRPFSAIRYLYGDEPVTAWGGVGMGTVDDITGNEWQSYVKVADHPEYPSVTALICEAHAEASRQFTGTDELGWKVLVEAGSSTIEPGITPSVDVELYFPTWSDFAEKCGQSRLWGGLHFQAAIDVARPVGKRVGALGYKALKAHIDGTAPPPGSPH
jgi:hypothetical protein